MKRSLPLRRESLAALDPGDLGAVVGGVSQEGLLCTPADLSAQISCNGRCRSFIVPGGSC